VGASRIVVELDIVSSMEYTVHTMDNDIETKYLVHAFMLRYQEREGRPPLLREIVAQITQLSHRSSVRHDLLCLEKIGLVREVGEPGTQRRWQAILPG